MRDDVFIISPSLLGQFVKNIKICNEAGSDIPYELTEKGHQLIAQQQQEADDLMSVWVRNNYY